MPAGLVGTVMLTIRGRVRPAVESTEVLLVRRAELIFDRFARVSAKGSSSPRLCGSRARSRQEEEKSPTLAT